MHVDLKTRLTWRETKELEKVSPKLCKTLRNPVHRWSKGERGGMKCKELQYGDVTWQYKEIESRTD